MSQTNLPLAASRPKHGHSRSQNLSINSIASITEPTTPPAVGSNHKLSFWDSNKLENELIFPSFIPDSTSGIDHAYLSKIFKVAGGQDKKVKQNYVSPVGERLIGKVDREYLAAIAKVPLSQLGDDILRLSKDQHGCRFLQKRIDASYVSNYSLRYANFEIILAQVKSSVYELIIDPFGNYLIQKLIGYFQESNLDDCLDILGGNLFLISINQYGTRALQKMIDIISTESQFSLLIRGLKPYIIEMIKDLNGNHVIQKILNKFRPEKCQFIYDSILGDFLAVATHKHGCCVLQKCLNHVTTSQHIDFANIILNFKVFSCIVNDQFGNYVLQYLMSVDSVAINYRLFENLIAYGLDKLCKLKFSSNVVEKLMVSCYKNEVSHVEFSNLKFTIIFHLLKGDVGNLVNNAYGNYVMQTLTDILINPKANYFPDMPSGGRVMLPSLRALLDDNVASSTDTLQAQVIKKWLSHCKIDSSFGRKLQFKINNVLQESNRVNEKMDFVLRPSRQILRKSKPPATGRLAPAFDTLDVLQFQNPAFLHSPSSSDCLDFYATSMPYRQNLTNRWPQENGNKAPPGMFLW